MMTHHRVLLGVLAGAVLGYVMAGSLSQYFPYSSLATSIGYTPSNQGNL
jgi:hypothetical protein